MAREHATDIGFLQTGLTQACIFRRYVSDAAIAVGDAVMGSATTDGRVVKTSAQGASALGVALDAAGAAGVTIRVAFAGVVPATVASATTVVRGDPMGLSSGSAGQLLNMANIGIGQPKTLLGFALESSASGSARLVKVQLAISRQVGLTSAVPVATSPILLSADGVATTLAASDHLHQTPGGFASLVADAAIANTETVVVSASLPAGFMKAGTTFRVRALGSLTTGATGGTAQFRCRVGPTTKLGAVVGNASQVNANSVSAAPFELEMLITIRTVGASGATMGVATVKAQTAAPIAFTSKDTIVLSGAPTVDTTIVNLIELTYISGNAGSTATFKVAELEVVKM